MANGLAAIEKIIVAEKPPKGSRQVGITDYGKIVWELPIVRGENVPDIDPATGEQRWELHPTTAKPLYPRRKLKRLDLVKTFVLVNDGQGNLYMEDFRFPTAEEKAEIERQRKTGEMLPALAAALVDRGLTAADLVEKMFAAPTAAPQPYVDPALRELGEALATIGLDAKEMVNRILAMNNLAPEPEEGLTAEEAAGLQNAFTEDVGDDADPNREDGTGSTGDDAVVYPLAIAGPGSRWRLSDQTVIKGKTEIEAHAAEAALHRAPQSGDNIPEQ